MENAAGTQSDLAAGQATFFDTFEEAAPVEHKLPDAPELPELERLAAEKDLLGFYVTGHPLERHRKILDMYAKGGERARKFARGSLDTVSDEHKLEPMAFALRSRSAAVRQLAAEELGRICGEAGSFNVIHPITGSCRRQDDVGSLAVGSLDRVTR